MGPAVLEPDGPNARARRAGRRVRGDVAVAVSLNVEERAVGVSCRGLRVVIRVVVPERGAASEVEARVGPVFAPKAQYTALGNFHALAIGQDAQHSGGAVVLLVVATVLPRVLRPVGGVA